MQTVRGDKTCGGNTATICHPYFSKACRMSNTAAKPSLMPVNMVIFAGFPLLALVLVPLWGFYHGYSGAQWLWALAFLYLNGLSITGGYHRLWAHKSYEAGPVAEVVLCPVGRRRIAEQHPGLGIGSPPPPPPR